MRFLAAFILYIVTTYINAYPLAPDKNMTTGSLCTALDSDFESIRYNHPFCKRNVSGYTKEKIYNAYSIPKEERKDYTIDHLIPLSIGGSNHISNLWPEHKEVKRLRYQLEFDIYTAYKEYRLSQDECVDIIKMFKFYHSYIFRENTK